ncbi:hypothetical protein WA026_018102 [Henosepilachna vigintioctopunctata]|uniref:Ubiquitin-associated protein 1 n=1 Tax=Henosepilachna vigintioctopunctata TaxID=420089 RepID=A0AAW1UKZ2_9CUCU
MMSPKNYPESGSYMDSVNVKIAEKYKPPPKKNIPMTHAQRLAFNNQIRDNLPKYDFSLESGVLQKVREWKNNRLITKEQRKMRLDALRDKEAEESGTGEDTSPEDIDVPTTSNDNERVISSVGYSYTTYSNGVLLPTKVTDQYSNILQPIPLRSDNTKFNNNLGVKSPFNISEFEADTSSPFDNVALKSINDVEELAKVWKIEDLEYSTEPRTSTAVSYSNLNISNIQSFPSYSTNYIPSSSCNIQNSVNTLNGYYNADIQSVRSFPSSYQCSPPHNAYLSTFTPSKFEMNHLAEDEKVNGKIANLINTASTFGTNSASTLKKQNDVTGPKNLCVQDLPDPFDELPKHLQELSRSISSMGFPLSRVARTCKAIGYDNKKVVDHLLAMSELLDLGFAEDKISEALLLCDNNRDKALDKLIS